MSTNLSANRPMGRRRKVKTYGEERVCITEGCSTRLSRYNRNTQCHTHAPRHYPRTRGTTESSPD